MSDEQLVAMMLIGVARCATIPEPGTAAMQRAHGSSAMLDGEVTHAR